MSTRLCWKSWENKDNPGDHPKHECGGVKDDKTHTDGYHFCSFNGCSNVTRIL